MIEVKADSYQTRYQWVAPGLARMERLHRWRKEPEVMIEVLGRFWMFGFTDFPEGLLSFGRHGELIPVSGKKCIFLPPFSVFESHIAGGNRKMHWEAFVALGDIPSDLPQSPVVFDAPSESYPKSMMEVSSILRAARNVVAIGKEERASAVAYKAKFFLDQHLTEEFPIHEMARELRFSHAVMDRASQGSGLECRISHDTKWQKSLRSRDADGIFQSGSFHPPVPSFYECPPVGVSGLPGMSFRMRFCLLPAFL